MSPRNRNTSPVHYWIPEAVWKNEEVFIYGGGTSLADFDTAVLQDELVIGCNDAYTYGPLVIDMCIFGDFKWYNRHEQGLKQYAQQGGIAVSCEPKANTVIGNNWLRKMPRIANGLAKDALGWNCNTGASALNLALILGAKKIFLLGFDMQLSEDGKRSNWHPNSLDRPRNTIYLRMMECFRSHVIRDWKRHFPHQLVYNVNDYSRLTCFPVLPFEAFWKERLTSKRKDER